MSMPTQFPASTHNELTERQQAVAELYKTEFSCSDEALRTITKTARQVLRVSRASIWLFTEDVTSIHCAYECDVRSQETLWHLGYSARKQLHLAEHEPYLVTLRESTTTTIEPLHEGLASPELRRYLRDLGIQSLLDVPLRIDGNLVGILCHEEQTQRKWSSLDQALAIRLGDLAALTIASGRHQRSAAIANKFRTLIEQTPDGIACCNANGYFEYLNSSAR